MKTQPLSTYFVAGFAVLFGVLSTVAAHGQEDTESKEDGSDAAAHLKNAAKKSFLSSSYRVEGESSIKRKYQKIDKPQKWKTTYNTRYEEPDMYAELHKEIGKGPMGPEGKKNVTIKIIGQINRKAGNITAFMKSDEKRSEWQNMAENTRGTKAKMFRRFKKPSNLPERLKEIKFQEDEKVNGRECRKITASLKEDKFKRPTKEILEVMDTTMKRMIADVEIILKSSNVTYWIRKDSKNIEKIDMNADLKLNILFRGDDQPSWIKEDRFHTMTFSDYGNTTVPEKHKKKFRALNKDRK